MRYYFCKIARKHHASTCTLWVSCDVDLALRRNAAREVQDRVPPAVVERMFDKFEEPGYTPSSKSSWEKHAAKVCTDASFTIPWDLIIEAFKHPHTAEEVNPDAELQAEEDRKRTRENQTHRLDLELRKAVGSFMSRTAKSCPKDTAKGLSQRCNELRKSCLESFKQLVDHDITSGELAAEEILQEFELRLEEMSLAKC
mmetsp:Transcript_13519/g.47022  ORF Transcript_13519/g.47022 Transcript_13519/m.47022 type:complete len:199 (-) Transcript_13519:21-617(-)